MVVDDNGRQDEGGECESGEGVGNSGKSVDGTC